VTLPARGGVASAAFELLCSDVHPIHCEHSLSSDTQAGLVAAAMRHGARVHGFTPVWYSPKRQAAIAAAVARSHR
jgi:hypothetical protein